MARIGYARVSTTDQDTDIQVKALKAAGCEIVRTEKRSGTSRIDRTELATTIEFLRKGDVLVITRIDRLARSIADLAGIISELEARGALLEATEQPINTATAAGRCFLQMLGVFAEFETNLRRELHIPGFSDSHSNGTRTGIPGCADKVRAGC